MAEDALGGGAAQTPATAFIGLHHVDLVAGGEDVGLVGEQLDGVSGAGSIGPRDVLFTEVEIRTVGHVADVGVMAVAGPTAWLGDGAIAELFRGLGKRMADDVEVFVELKIFTEIVAGEHDGATGVFLFATAEEIRGVAELSLHLFFAVAEIVVGNERDDDAGRIAGGELEGGTVVVALGGVFPAHAVASLTRRGVVEGRETKLFFRQRAEMGSDDNTAGVTGPRLRIEGGVVFWEMRIAGVAEDAFDKIKVRDEGARNEEAGLHGTLRREAGDGGAHHWAQVERNETLSGCGLGGGEGEPKKFDGRVEGVLQQAAKNGRGDRFLIVGNRQAAFGDVENAGRGAAVAAGVVEDALARPVGREDVALVGVATGGQGQDAGEAGAVEDEGGGRDPRGLRVRIEVVVEKVLDTLIHRAEMARERAILFAADGQEVIDERCQAVGRTRFEGDAGLADLAELEVEIGEQLHLGVGGVG